MRFEEFVSLQLLLFRFSRLPATSRAAERKAKMAGEMLDDMFEIGKMNYVWRFLWSPGGYRRWEASTKGPGRVAK